MTSSDGGTVDQLWRFPVKSMQGESVASVEVTERGVAGDRLWALVDVSDGKVVSAKNPRKWARVLELSAAYVDDVGPDGAAPPPVAVTLPDGTVVRSDVASDDASGVLSRFLGREVRLTASVPEAPVMEETWPDDVEGLAPASFIESTRIASDDGDTVSDIRMAMAAPPGTFFDLASLHLLTTSTLASLRAAHPDGDFDVRRYRPNVVVATSGGGFVENDWVGRSVALGSAGAATEISMATMRCVMTTMAQPGLVRDVSLLQTIARTNRLSMLGGQWACAGAYGSVAGVGTVRVGDPVSVAAPA
jgi:uncharacterized protein YcbX